MCPTRYPSPTARRTLSEILEAYARLVGSQHRLVQTLISSGMITERAGIAVLAQLDQVEAGLADVLSRHG